MVINVQTKWWTIQGNFGACAPKTIRTIRFSITPNFSGAPWGTRNLSLESSFASVGSFTSI
jgi:hypothetical protein